MLSKEREIKPGEFYKHFKNKLYQVIAIATHSETKEKMVVYQALYSDFGTYVRPYEMFVSEVDHEKYPEVTQKYRFEKYDIHSAEIVSNATIHIESIPEICLEIESEEEEGEISPLLLEFLDCNTYEEKLDKFVRMKDKIDDRLLNDIAMSLDIAIDTKKLQDKYEEIKACLLTFVHFEDNRLR